MSSRAVSADSLGVHLTVTFRKVLSGFGVTLPPEMLPIDAEDTLQSAQLRGG